MRVRRDVGEQRAAIGMGLDQIAHAAQNHVAGESRSLGAVGEGRRQHAPILDVDGIGLEHGTFVRTQTRRDIADVARHARHRDRLSPRAGLDLLEIEHRRKRMASHPDQRTAAGHRPLRGVRGEQLGDAVETGSRQENASKQELEPRSDSIGTEKALPSGVDVFVALRPLAECDKDH